MNFESGYTNKAATQPYGRNSFSKDNISTKWIIELSIPNVSKYLFNISVLDSSGNQFSNF